MHRTECKFPRPVGTQRESHENKWGVFSDDLGLRSPVIQITKTPKNKCYLYRSTRQKKDGVKLQVNSDEHTHGLGIQKYMFLQNRYTKMNIWCKTIMAK